MKTIRIEEKAIVQEFVNLVKIPSDSGDCTEIAEFIIKKFDNLKDWKTRKQTVHPGDLNLIVSSKKKETSEPLLFAAHMDTVSPGKGILPAVKNGRVIPTTKTILGADNKSAIAVFIYGLRLAKQHHLPLIPLEFLFTYGEEHGLMGAKNLDRKLIRSKQGLCFDSDGNVGTITISAPTYMKYKLDITGRSAHSGIEPEKGISAIKVLAEIISLLPNGRLDKNTTTNIGMISGGRALNIIPENASAEGEVRSVLIPSIRKYLKTVEDIAKKTCTKHKAKFRMSVAKEFDGFLIPSTNPLLQKVSETLKEIGCPVNLNKSNGGSDANILNGHGILMLNMAIGMQNAHTQQEYITVENLKKAVALFIKLISKEKIEVVF